MLACDIEFKKVFGDNYQIIQKNPIVVQDDVGNLWIFTKSPKKEYGWFKYENDEPNFEEELE